MYGFYTSPKIPGVCPWRIKRSSYERAAKKEMTTPIAGSGRGKLGLDQEGELGKSKHTPGQAGSAPGFYSNSGAG